MRQPLAPIAFLALLACTTPLAAQSAGVRPTASVYAGVSQWDLSGTGTSPFVAVRADRPLAGRVLLGEVSLGFFSPDEQTGARRRYWLPEAQLQLQLPTVVAPYVGAGVGAIFAQGGDSDVTFSLAGGLRTQLPGSRLGLGAELRVRGIGTGFGASSAEWTAGLRWRL